MTTFDSREKGFENKYAHDEELVFKVRARRNHLLGLWAAEKHGKTGDQAESHAKDFLLSTLDHSTPSSDIVLAARLHAELAPHHPALQEKEVLVAIDLFGKEARKQIVGE